MFHRRVALTLVFGSCLAVESARAQTLLREWRGATQGDGLALGLADLGDVDLDGVHDFAIGVPGDDTVGADRGKVIVQSGADGHEIRTLHGAHYDMRYGTSVYALGDVDLDGIPDLLVGAVGAAAYGTAAYAIHFAALSGVDGSTLWTYALPPGQNGWVGSVARLGDTNLDGRPDVAISMPGQGSPSHAGVIVVLSGLDGSILQQVTGPLQDAYIGIGLSAAGDLDGDGRADWWNTRNVNFFYNRAEARSGLDGHLLADIGLPYHYESDYNVHLVGGNDVNGDGAPDLVAAVAVTPGYGLHGPGHIVAYSGANQAVLWTRYGESDALRIGWWLSDVGDLDGDGVRDLGTSVGYGVQYSGYADSRAQFLSGATGVPFGGLTLPPSELTFTRVLSAGDVDGDGHGDFLYGAVNSTYVSGQYVYSPGVARVSTLAREGLKADRFELDHTLGGTQTLTLDFGPAYAGRSYRVLGSVSGTVPGLTTSAGVVPLAVDPYFVSTLRGLGDVHLTSASGTLDAQGRATAAFTLPAESMRFPRDTVVHHAAIVLNAADTSVAVVSRAVPLRVTVAPCHADPFAVDDCDSDGMRDGCQVNLPGTVDCNHNARPDACDLASGGSSDCNGDQVPDECTDYLHDVNQNDVPDTCEVKTFYVDDDALNDPGPGSTAIFDPLANGSLQHPFDSIRKAIAVATPLDTIVLEDGLYSGNDNKGLPLFGRVHALQSRNGPNGCVIDAENYGAVIYPGLNTTHATELVGITIQHTGIFTTGYGSHPNQATSLGDILIKNCRFLDGASDKNPGLQAGVYAGATLVIENCVFARNFSGPQGTDGFALEVLPLGGTCTLRNCLFADDSSFTGKIPVSISGNAVIDHCTFFGQSGVTQAVLKLTSGSCSLSNSIVWTDGSTPVLVVSAQASASYVLAKGGAAALAAQSILGVGILDANPQFVHAAGEDFHILSTSPCVDAGDPAFIAAPGEVDGDGDPRVINGRTDIGWDEQL